MEKVLLVTGASSEVGMILTRGIYKDYSRIYLQYRSMNAQLQNLIDDISKETDIVPLQADFHSENEVVDMIENIRESGILPNQIVHFPAPKAYNKQFHKDKWGKYELGWEISVHSIVLILQAFLPNMVKAKYGRVLFMLTSCTLGLPPKYQASYVTVKYALLGLMKSLSVEYIGKGITVNGVSPDMMETKFLSELPELIVEKNAMNSPLGRNIHPEEVIPVFKYILSDEGAAMTGQNIAITGGI